MVVGDVPRHELNAVYEPMLNFVVQGSKRLSSRNTDSGRNGKNV
jgi:hypothetical protein